MDRLSFPLIFGSFFGLTSVMLGAFGAHYLITIFPTTQLSVFDTAVRDQMYHSLILSVIGFYILNKHDKYLIYSSYSFIIGVVLFSGSLYLYLPTNIVLFAIVTPVGGLFLILGWLLLFYFALTKMKE